MKSSGSSQQALSEMEAVYRQLSPSVPFSDEFVDQEYDTRFRAEERIGKLARIFAVPAILISCLGIFGRSTFIAERKTKEIGIRKVPGASVAGLWPCNPGTLSNWCCFPVLLWGR